MGWLKKVTGAQAQIDATNQNEQATSAATRATAQANINQSQEAARQAAQSASLIVERQAAADKASAAVSLPLDTAEVQLDSPTTDSAAGAANKKRRAWGTGAYSTGVNI